MKYDIEELRRINTNKIEELKNKENTKKKEIEIHITIKEILEDSSCFFKIDMKTGINILSKLIEEESIKETYLDLISAEKFKKTNNLK